MILLTHFSICMKTRCNIEPNSNSYLESETLLCSHCQQCRNFRIFQLLFSLLSRQFQLPRKLFWLQLLFAIELESMYWLLRRRKSRIPKKFSFFSGFFYSVFFCKNFQDFFRCLYFFHRSEFILYNIISIFILLFICIHVKVNEQLFINYIFSKNNFFQDFVF